MLAGEEMTKAASSDNLDAGGVDMEELDKAMDKKLECLRDLLVDADKLRYAACSLRIQPCLADHAAVCHV